MSQGRGPPRIEGMVSLKVDNLPFRTTTNDLRKAFGRCGEVGDIYIPRNRDSRESRGFAFVRFYDKRDAEDALKAMDGTVFDGRELRVQMARYGRPDGRERGREQGFCPRRSRSYTPRRRSRSRSGSRYRSPSPIASPHRGSLSERRSPQLDPRRNRYSRSPAGTRFSSL